MGRRTAGSRPLARAVARAWYEESPGLTSRLLLGCLAPAAWAYDAAATVRGKAYDIGLIGVRRAPVPVVSVGNLVVGGAGKTPVVMDLVSRLEAMGHKVAIASRGYGAGSRSPRIVSDGSRLLLGPEEAGDEPYLMAGRCPGAVVLAGSDRGSLVERAAHEFSCTVAVLDDGMQHRGLHRNLEVVVVDASSPVGNGHLFPRGPMRERSTCLARAQILWLSRADEAPGGPLAGANFLEGMLARAGCPVVRSRYVAEGLTSLRGEDAGGLEKLEGAKVLALSGIARPSSFHLALKRAGADVVDTRAYPDHHPFSPAEIAEARSRAVSLGALLVTTEKDAARLHWEGGDDVLVLRIGSRLIEGEDALGRLLAALAPPTPARSA